MIERFKLGQDKTTGGNVESSLDFSAWSELTTDCFLQSDVVATNEAYFAIKERLTYGWHLSVQPLAKLKQLKRIDL